MGKIYSRAKHTLVWIGPERDESTKALEIMQHLSDRISNDWNNCAMRPKKKCSGKEMQRGDAHVTLPYQNGELNAVLSLFSSAEPGFNKRLFSQAMQFYAVVDGLCRGSAFARLLHVSIGSFSTTPPS